MSFRGGRGLHTRGGGLRSRGRFRGRSRERSLSRDRARHRIGRSRSRSRERTDVRRNIKPDRFDISPKEEKPRRRLPTPDRFRERRFEDAERRPRFEPREELQFEFPTRREVVFERNENEFDIRRNEIERMDRRPPEIIERRAEIIERRLEVPERREEQMRFSPINFESRDPQDKPDPWSDPPQTQLMPNFGQGKGSALISDFDPDTSTMTAHAWLKQLDKVSWEKKWMAEERKFHFSMKLQGAAKEWFISGNKILEPWSTLKKQFLSTFVCDMDYYRLLDKMMRRVKFPEEELGSYFNYKIVLLNSCKISGRKAVSCLIGGLPDTMADLKEAALDQNFSTPEELYEFLNEREQIAANSPQKMPMKNKKCFNCKMLGHLAVNCPSHDLQKPEEGKARCYKDILVDGHPVKAIFDDDCPNITIRECDVEMMKIKYRRQITIIDGKDRNKLTTLGQTMVFMHVDSVNANILVYVVKDMAQNTPVVLGRAIRRYAHYIEDRNGVHFAPLEKAGEEEKREKRRSLSPGRKEGRGQRSPVRHSSPGRNFKDSHPFLSKFYGNPYQ